MVLVSHIAALLLTTDVVHSGNIIRSCINKKIIYVKIRKLGLFVDEAYFDESSMSGIFRGVL